MGVKEVIRVMWARWGLSSQKPEGWLIQKLGDCLEAQTLLACKNPIDPTDPINPNDSIDSNNPH